MGPGVVTLPAGNAVPVRRCPWMIDVQFATAHARIGYRTALLRFPLSRKIRIRKSP
jgi:hypothetical protein